MVYRSLVTQKLPRVGVSQTNEPTAQTASQLRKIWCQIAVDTLNGVNFEFGESMIDLAELLGFMVLAGECRTTSVSGTEITHPRWLSYQEINAAVALELAAIVLARAGLAGDDSAKRFVAWQLILPYRCAAELEPEDLAGANPHVPLNELQRAYFSAEGSGEIPAVLV